MDFIPPIDLVTEPDSAEYQREIIVELIKDFQDSLDLEHELAVSVVNCGITSPMYVDEISFCNPNLIIFSGTVNGSHSVLIQNTNQINFLLTSVRKPDSNKPPRRIGFTA